jgi:molybdopterin converting factor small subunit
MIERYTPTLERRETLDERMARPMGGVALLERDDGKTGESFDKEQTVFDHELQVDQTIELGLGDKKELSPEISKEVQLYLDAENMRMDHILHSLEFIEPSYKRRLDLKTEIFLSEEEVEKTINQDEHDRDPDFIKLMENMTEAETAMDRKASIGSIIEKLQSPPASKQLILEAASLLGDKIPVLKRLGSNGQYLGEKRYEYVGRFDEQSKELNDTINSKTEEISKSIDLNKKEFTAKKLEALKMAVLPEDIGQLQDYEIEALINERAEITGTAIKEAIEAGVNYTAMINDPEFRKQIDAYPRLLVGESRLLVGELGLEVVQKEIESLKNMANERFDVSAQALEALRKELLKTNNEASQLFTMDTIPAAFIGDSERQKAKLVTEKIAELKAKYPELFKPELNQNIPEVNVENNIETAQNNLEAQVEDGDKVYFHFTANLDKIIKSGALKPRINVPKNERVTTTGDHSVGVHFTLDLGYSSYSTYKTERSGIFGIAYPLSEIISHTPYRAELTHKPGIGKSKEGDDYNLTTDSVFYDSYKITGSGNAETRGGTDYEYPINEGVMFVPDVYREEYTRLLEDAGYNKEWVGDHLLAISQDVINNNDKVVELVTEKIKKLLEKEGKGKTKIAPLLKTKRSNKYGSSEHLDGGKPDLIDKLVVV